MQSRSMKLFELAYPPLFALLMVVQPARVSAAPSTPAPGAGEVRASRAYQAALRQGPLAVQAFLANFPKGADLHFHFGAGVYA
jgi:hypothetical protein